MSVFVKMRDCKRVKERSWWWMVLYSDALISGYGPFIHSLVAHENIERDKRTREGVATHVDPLFAVLSSNGSLIVSVRGIAHHCFQSPLQSSTFLSAAWMFVHRMSRNKQRWVRRWKALHVWAREEREDGVRCSKMQSQTSAGTVFMSMVMSCMVVCEKQWERVI